MFKTRKNKTDPAPTGSAASAEAKPSESVSQKPRAVSQEAKTCTLTGNISFEGSLKFSGTVHLDCRFRGNIVTDDKLVIGRAGCVDAEIVAGSVEIAGKLCGNIKAVTSVKIKSGAEVQGNIETPMISMEDGVMFDGTCTRPQPKKRAESAPKPAAKEPRPVAVQSVPSKPAAPESGAEVQGNKETPAISTPKPAAKKAKPAAAQSEPSKPAAPESGSSASEHMKAPVV